MEKQSDYIIASVQKALKVLKLFDARHKDMTLTEISELADMRKGTMIRVLTTLEEEGFVRYDSRSKRYYLGAAIYKLSTSAFQFNDLVSIARPLLEEVTAQMSLTAHVATLDGCKIMLVDRVLPNASFNVYDLNSIVGGEIEPHCTGVGKVITAFSDPKIQKQILDTCTFERRSEYTITDRNEFMQALQEVRKNGYAINLGENEPYLKCVTYPVFNFDGNIAAAISLTGISQYFDDTLENQTHEILNKLTREVSRQLGYGI